MLLKVKAIKWFAGRAIAILHEETAKLLNVHVGERVSIAKGKPNKKKRKEIIAAINITSGILNKNEIALSHEIVKNLRLRKREFVDVNPTIKPLSVHYIRKKLKGEELSFTEIYSIISDIVHNKLTEAEVAYFVSGVYVKGMTLDEIVSVTKAMVKTGQTLNIQKPVIIDKHSIGGIEGNRTTPILVSILGAAIDKLKLNAIMPKTSSRAITSAAGNADAVETITRVEFSINEIKRIIKKTNSCIVWGGSLGLAPADDKIIQVERLISLDPESQLIASILSKKLAVNATHILIDISYGKSAKVPSITEAIALKNRFLNVARKLNMNLKVALTDGKQPIGNGIGPILEMIDVMQVLKQEKNRPRDLEKKSLFLAQELLCFVTRMPRRKAEKICKTLLYSGAALEKFKQIVEAQQGSLKNLKEKLKLAKFKTKVLSKHEGTIRIIDNKKIAYIARLAGCPADRASGIYLHKHVGDRVIEQQPLFSIYAETKEKLNHAKHICEVIKPILVE